MDGVFLVVVIVGGILAPLAVASALADLWLHIEDKLSDKD